MNFTLPTAAKVLTGIFLTAACALPQAYTISAKPGVINYLEGSVFLNGKPVSAGSAKAVFMNAGDIVSTDIGKAEVLLTPGVFLRLGANTQVRMVSPSLTDTQLEVKAGEAMIEADNIIKDSRITVMAGGGSLQVDKNGLFRVRAGEDASVAVLEGKATFYNGDRKTDIGKGKELFIAEGKSKKFDTKKADDLYAWSNVRSEYNAASSYQAAKDINYSSYGGVWGGYGFGSYGYSGWLWNSAFNSYSWMPINGAFYSPFGYGFYSPGFIGYAPVIYAPIYGYAGRPVSGGGGGGTAVAKAPTRAVPVNPVAPPAVGAKINSPMANQAARTQALHTYSSNGGFKTATGAAVPAGRAASAAGYGAGARGAAGGGRPAGVSSPGMSAGRSAGSVAGASAPAGRSAAPASAARH
jgi:hypothetical protein